jgi:hypothetical protein
MTVKAEKILGGLSLTQGRSSPLVGPVGPPYVQATRSAACILGHILSPSSTFHSCVRAIHLGRARVCRLQQNGGSGAAIQRYVPAALAQRVFLLSFGFLIPTLAFDSVVVVAATLLARLRDGTAKFELLEDSAPAPAPPSWTRLHCFAKIAPSLYVCVFCP